MYKELDTILEWVQDGKYKSLRDNPQMIDVAIAQFHALLEAAQQVRALDAAPQAVVKVESNKGLRQ